MGGEGAISAPAIRNMREGIPSEPVLLRDLVLLVLIGICLLQWVAGLDW